MPARILSTLLLFLFGYTPQLARAELWCAEPVWAHEWGVQSFDTQGHRQRGPSVPSWFHRAPRGPQSNAPVRHLPADGGERELPVLHFYSRPTPEVRVPIGIEVAFAEGEATAWYPQVDGRRGRAATRTAAARASHARLASLRADPTRATPIPRDPTFQLFWDHLLLTGAPQHTPRPSTEAWVQQARTFGALWANNGRESERFVFYEANTEERVAVVLERGSTWRTGRHQILVHNRSAHPVHDVFVTHHEGSRSYALLIPTIAAGQRAGFVLEDHAEDRRNFRRRLQGQLRARLVDPQEPNLPTNHNHFENCVMGRNPALPQERTEGHRLFDHEVDLVLQSWAPRFFPDQGTTVVYRESTAYLDAMMPISLFTDMYHYIRLRRLGLAVHTTRLPQ